VALLHQGGQSTIDHYLRGPLEAEGERIVLIDNCSTDGSAAAAREWVARDGRLTARIEQIDSAVNAGFAATNNRAVEACRT
jgi:glycosyltransferase involved in cell wall biosynthesis